MAIVMEEEELKGGHPPAVKVGGRRVTNKKDRRPSETERTTSESSDEIPKELDPNLPAELERCYPTNATRQVHEKLVAFRQEPVPMECKHAHVRANNTLFQPKKHN